MESQSQNPEFRNNLKNFHPWRDLHSPGLTVSDVQKERKKLAELLYLEKPPQSRLYSVPCFMFYCKFGNICENFIFANSVKDIWYLPC